MNKLRRIFNADPPDPNDPFIKQIEEAIRKSHEERWCASCAHYIEDNPLYPSFVTSGPICALSGDAAIENCDKYKEEMSLEDALRALYGKDVETPKKEKGNEMEKETLKAAKNTNPNSLAGAIAETVRKQNEVEIQAIGAGAINQTMKAIAIARGFMAPSGVDLVAIPSFHDFEMNGKKHTALRIQVEQRQKRNK